VCHVQTAPAHSYRAGVHPQRLIRAGDLVGTREIADLLGVQPSTVSSWRRRQAAWPQPVAMISRIDVWAWPDVEAWVREHRPELAAQLDEPG
jgi:prophage regulatory protein